MTDKKGMTRDEIYRVLRSNGLSLIGQYTSRNIINVLDSNGIAWGKSEEVTAKCKGCGEMFNPKSGKMRQGRDRKFCTDLCKKTNGGKRILRTDPRNCNVCGVSFTPKPGKGKGPESCSEECRSKAKAAYYARDHYKNFILPKHLEKQYEKSRRKTLDRVKICRKCSNAFKRPSAHYCSDECKILHKREMKASYFKLPEVIENRKLWSSQPHRIKKRNQYVRARRKVRRSSDVIYLLKERIRCRTRAAFNGCGFTKGCKTREMIGCSWEQFKQHIESKFTKGMRWSNRHLWDIDHIIPLASGKTEEELIRLSHFSNLRPLWRAENIRKSDSIVDCQPELTLKHE